MTAMQNSTTNINVVTMNTLTCGGLAVVTPTTKYSLISGQLL